MEASKIFAEKAQASAENMEEMTRNMEKLTEKTTKETVSMKIITLVTMFFLPGTFISVRSSSSFIQ
jgi:Mg2+ and Co2+ transporter CorA